MNTTDRHIASAFDRDLETVQALVVKMGGLVESAISEAAAALEARTTGWATRGQRDGLGLETKFVGDRALVERCVVALATDRGLMLVGEPGTAKSFLSELLAAAVSGVNTDATPGGVAASAVEASR